MSDCCLMPNEQFLSYGRSWREQVTFNEMIKISALYIYTQVAFQWDVCVVLNQGA